LLYILLIHAAAVGVPSYSSHLYSLYTIYIYIYRLSQEECARLREGVPCGKVYRYNPKHLCPKLNGYGDNGQRKVWSTCGSTHCTYQLTSLSMSVLEGGVALRHCVPVMCHVQVLGNLRSITTCLRVVLYLNLMASCHSLHFPASFNMYLVNNKCVTAVKVSNFSGHYLRNRQLLT
jgi:hypothetical protein